MNGEELAHALRLENNELKTSMEMPEINFQNNNEFDAVLKIKGEKLRKLKEEEGDKKEDFSDSDSVSLSSVGKKSNEIVSDPDTISADISESEADEDKMIDIK
jgi:hypothetical protein